MAFIRFLMVAVPLFTIIFYILWNHKKWTKSAFKGVVLAILIGTVSLLITAIVLFLLITFGG
jgi:multisubunit Na+/H+ antiporter MnhB subunit